MSGQMYHADPSQLTDPDNPPFIEVFTVPDDYPMVECDDGKLLEHGIYYWFVNQENCVPKTYAMGPFDTTEEALADARMAYAGEP